MEVKGLLNKLFCNWFDVFIIVSFLFLLKKMKIIYYGIIFFYNLFSLVKLNLSYVLE